MKSFFKTFLMAFSLVFIMTSAAQADCPEGYYQIEQNSCCSDGSYNGCCGTNGWVNSSSCTGGDPDFQPWYGYCGSGGCYVIGCPADCQPDPAYNDCNGDHMGGATYDECGVCDGDGSSCADCAGVPNGGATYDDCGVCDGGNADQDCAGVCGGDSVLDECGECGGSGPDQHFTCSGFKPETKAALQEAVDLWVSSPESTEATYGHISDWDVSLITDMSELFRNKVTFNDDIGNWDVSGVTDMNYMFRDADSFNQDLSSWDVSSVTDMSHMFWGADSFNGDISAWDVSDVTNMKLMFRLSPFNGDISGWDVSGVTNMNSMFYQAPSFNQDISGWDVSGATSMSHMFREADSFNQDLSSWDVSSVTNMQAMFDYNDVFNQDLSGWDVSSVTDMSYMFRSADSFNQDLSSWDVSSVTTFEGMFHQNSLSDENKCAIQTTWSANNNWQYDWTENIGCDGVCFSDAQMTEYWADNDGDGLGASEMAFTYYLSSGTSLPAQARNICDLAMPKDAIQQAEILEVALEASGSYVWLGGSFDSELSQWVWDDGTIIGSAYSGWDGGDSGYMNWDNLGQQGGIDGGSSQPWLSISLSSGQWHDHHGNGENYYFVCGDEGVSSGTMFCDALVEDGWVTNSDDEDDNCFSNAYDCAEECTDTGDAAFDECGVCEGDNSSCADCFGVPNGDAVIDDCGVCGGDSSLYGTFDVTHIVALVEAVLDNEWVSCSDVNADGSLDIVDIVMMVDEILGYGRITDATLITLINSGNSLELESDGFVGGIQMTLSHGEDFAIELSDNSMVSDYRTNGTQTVVIIAVPEEGSLFTTTSVFTVEDVTAATSAGEIEVTTPMAFGLSTAYPNPFNPSTSIDLHMSTTEMVSVDVYNVMGQLVDTIHSGELSSGVHTFIWNGSEISSGVYFIKATSASNVASQKVMLLK